MPNPIAFAYDSVEGVMLRPDLSCLDAVFSQVWKPMLDRIANALIGQFGYRLVRAPGRRPKCIRLQDRPEARTLIAQIQQDPTDIAAHSAYARLALQHGQAFLAHAQARTAEWLASGDSTEISGMVRATASALPPLNVLGHNAYHRLHSLARILREIGLGPTSSVLDVGGGQGELAAFVSPSRYFLADPVANGISSAGLAGSIGPFDYVVSCHVLEHVEPAARDSFMDTLLERAGIGVVLLNPFHLPGTSEEERLRLVIDITDAHWAKEHLACTLPHLEDIQKYAASRGVECKVQPIGAMTTALAFVFAEHFAHAAGMSAEIGQINRFFNDSLCDAELSERSPTGFAVVLSRRAGNPISG